MRPIFFSFKSINITWFMALGLLGLLLSYFTLKFFWGDDKEKSEKLENIFFFVVIFGFIGARIMYVALNLRTFMASPTALLKISHYNLSLIGGVISGLIVLVISSKIYKIKLHKVLNIFTPLFFLSMIVGVWNFLFDIFLLNSYNLGNANIRVMFMSLLFLLALILQIILGKRCKFKYACVILLIFTLIIYYIIKLGLIF